MSVPKGTRGRRTRPAMSAEGREDQLISLAFDLAEQQLKDGSASSQVITQLLKSGSRRDRLEQKRLENDNLLLSAKVGQIEASERVDKMYTEALSAMRQYTGQPADTDPDEEDY